MATQITPEPSADAVPGFQWTELRRISPVLVMPESHPLARLKKIAPARLRDLRTERKLSVAAVARLVGVNRATLWNIEQGHRRPGPAILDRLCLALDVPADQLTK